MIRVYTAEFSRIHDARYGSYHPHKAVHFIWWRKIATQVLRDAGYPQVDVIGLTLGYDDFVTDENGHPLPDDQQRDILNKLTDVGIQEEW